MDGELHELSDARGAVRNLNGFFRFFRIFSTLRKKCHLKTIFLSQRRID